MAQRKRILSKKHDACILSRAYVFAEHDAGYVLYASIPEMIVYLKDHPRTNADCMIMYAVQNAVDSDGWDRVMTFWRAMLAMSDSVGFSVAMREKDMEKNCVRMLHVLPIWHPLLHELLSMILGKPLPVTKMVCKEEAGKEEDCRNEESSTVMFVPTAHFEMEPTHLKCVECGGISRFTCRGSCYAFQRTRYCSKRCQKKNWKNACHYMICHRR